MSAEIAVKKKGRPKKVGFEEAPVVVEGATDSGAQAKKAPSKKSSTFAQAKPTSSTSKATSRTGTKGSTPDGHVGKPGEALKSASPSKVAAKTTSSCGESQTEYRKREAPPSKILKEATAFGPVAKDSGVQGLSSKPAAPTSTFAAPTIAPDVKARESANAPVGLSLPPKTDRKAASDAATTTTIRSSFLKSFLDDSESAPTGGEPVGPEPESGRPEYMFPDAQQTLQQSNNGKPHDNGKMNTMRQTPMAAFASLGKDQLDIRSNLRAYTTSSFAAMKASSADAFAAIKTKSPASKSQAPANASAPGKASNSPASKTKTATPTPSKPVTKAAASTAAKSVAKPSSTHPKASTTTTNTNPTTTPPSSTTPKSTSPPIQSSPTTARLPPKAPPNDPYPQTPPQKPTTMNYRQLTSQPQYRSLAWKWTAVMVSIPFAIWTSVELYSRYERQMIERGETPVGAPVVNSARSLLDRARGQLTDAGRKDGLADADGGKGAGAEQLGVGHISSRRREGEGGTTRC